MAKTEPDRDAYLVEHIRELLLHDHRVGELDIHVAVEGHVVLVTGHVSTADRHEAISRALAKLLPEYEVQNETTVTAYPEPPEEAMP
jgi:hypothetical protein